MMKNMHANVFTAHGYLRCVFWVSARLARRTGGVGAESERTRLLAARGSLYPHMFSHVRPCAVRRQAGGAHRDEPLHDLLAEFVPLADLLVEVHLLVVAHLG